MATRFNTTISNTALSSPVYSVAQTGIKNDIVGDLFLGGGVQKDRGYLGAELLLSFAGHLQKEFHLRKYSKLFLGANFVELTQDGRFRTKLRTTSIVLDVQPGVLIASKTLLYAVFGVALNRLQGLLGHSVNGYADAEGPVFNSTIVNSRDYNKHITGLRIGAGIKNKITDSILLFLNYVFTRYGRSNIQLNQLTTAVDAGTGIIGAFRTALADTIRPTRQDILFGFDYYFNRAP